MPSQTHLAAYDLEIAPEPVDARHGTVDYLGFVRPGFIFTDRSGRIITCTPPATKIIEDLVPGVSILSLRQLLRFVLANASSEPKGTKLRLRRLQKGVSFGINQNKRTIQLEVQRMADGGWAIMLDDITKQKAEEDRSAELARLDPLTSLPNRLMLRERLDEALDRLTRTGETCAVLLIDLDRFKPVNDTLGHAIGDALLEKVADRLRSCVRATDTVARIGGDEFVILQTATASMQSTQLLANRIVDLVSRAYIVEGQLLSIGASVGIAVAPGDAVAADQLLRNADLALYRAKVDGRGMYRFFEPEMDARMQARRQLELDMRQALARREFQLHYQPQLNLENNTLVGCEALIRWMHPQRGSISPADFIPLAEEVGLIVPIGEWVIRQACRDAAGWPANMTVAVNVSPAQFKSERLVDTVLSALSFSGLSPARLEIEITEGVLLQESNKTLRTLHQLRDLGVRVSMDDFGTGYSSLSYLRSFPFDKIKIDRSFILDMAKQADGNAIIRAIAGLGKSLGMTTVAEGVETAEQMERIRAEGCTDVQGYLISKPIPLDDLLTWIAGFQPTH